MGCPQIVFHEENFKLKSIAFNEGIGIDDAEDAISILSGSPDSLALVVLDLTATRSIEIGAGPRLGNLLRRFSGEKLKVRLPSMAQQSPKDYVSEHWKLLVRSGLGMGIATHAGTIMFGDLPEREGFRELFLEEQDRRMQNILLIPNIHSTSRFDFEDRTTFSNILRSYLPTLNATERHFNSDGLAALVEFCRESILNVRDHSYKRPWGEGQRSVSYFSIRYHKRIPFVKTELWALKQYFKRVNDSYPGASSTSYLEIVINDDGNGIAARQGLDSEIYWHYGNREEEFFAKALSPGGSVKPLARDSLVRGHPGYGFSAMASSLRALKGIGLVRSGKLLAVYDGTCGNPQSTIFGLAPSNYRTHLRYMPGTFIQTIIPIGFGTSQVMVSP